MSRRPILVVLALVLLVVTGRASSAPSPGNPLPFVTSPAVIDTSRRLDVNRLDLWASNTGWVGFDGRDGGLLYPRGEGVRRIFLAGGLWIGAKVGSETRVTVAEYSSEWRPGRIVGGVPDPPLSDGLRTWKVVPAASFSVPEDTLLVVRSGVDGLDPVDHHGWTEYRAVGGPAGAPLVAIRLPDPESPGDSIRILAPPQAGQLALASVFNDADPAAHTNQAGASAPLGLEVHQTVFGNELAPSNVAIVNWTIHHRGTEPLDSVRVSYWLDPDIGGRSDDLAGWDSTLQMGYVYNATNSDLVFGGMPPAIGVRHVGGATGNEAGAFAVYINGLDPASPDESYRLQRGTRANGEAWIDPDTRQPSVFPYDGDPVTGTGWLDGPQTADRKILVTTRWFPLAPGVSVNFVFAIGVGWGRDRLDSIERLRCQMRLARLAMDRGFRPIFPSGIRLTAARSTSEGVHLAWNASSIEPRPLELRSVQGAPIEHWPWWSDDHIGELWPDTNGNLAWEGPPLTTKQQVAYALFDPCDPSTPLGGVMVRGPGFGELTFRAASPASGALGLSFGLPTAGPTRVEAFAVDGRRMLARDLGTLDFGPHTIVLPESAAWPSGLYFLRLLHPSGQETARTVIVH